MKIKTIIYLSTTIIALLSNAVSAATNQDFSILNAEKVSFSKNTINTQNNSIKYLSFSSFEQEFDLILQENNKLLNGFSPKRTDLKLYSGKIEGNSKSWARITVIGDEYTGAIFDGQELYLLDVAEDIVKALSNKDDIKDAKTVIYKSSDLSSDLTCGTHNEHESAFAYDNLLPDSSHQQHKSDSSSLNSDNGIESNVAAAANLASQQLDLRIVVDTEFALISTPDAQTQVLSLMNIVDGIFSEQVDVQFGITSIEVLNNNGLLTSSNASTLLGQFRTFIGSNNPGLAHLFTGRELDGNTVGIASLPGICRTSGAGLTQATGSFGALIAAHEFGHNFGAPHDAQTGSACASTAGTFLMNPSINGSDQFSQCSLQQIANTLASAQCLTPVNNTPIEPAASCDFSIDFANGANDFEFIDDPQTPSNSSSSIFGGSINILLSGQDGTQIEDIEGVWFRQCISDNGSNLRFNLQASLEQSADYEANEFSQIALRVNGTNTILETLTGDGNGGATPSTGIQQYSVDVSLNQGINTIELICFNNQATQQSETTECRFNSLETGIPEAEVDNNLCLPIRAENSNLAVICL